MAASRIVVAAAAVVAVAAVAAVAVGAAVAVSAVGAAGAATGAHSAALTPSPRAALHGRIVVAISVDGLSVGALRTLGRSDAPSMFRMRRHGAGTLNARTLRERTITLPNHTAMMTGRRMSGPHGHGVGFNDDTGGVLHEPDGSYVEGIFDAVHDRGGSTALYVSKDKFAFLARSWDPVHGRRDRVGADSGRDKIDRFQTAPGPRLVRRLVSRLTSAEPHTLSFLHLAAPDVAGHRHGWMSAPYLTAVRRTDHRVGRVLRTIRQDPWLRRHTVVVLTADHGGRPGTRGHSERRRRVNYTVPFFVWGAGVADGANLYALNPSRDRPGRARTTYAGPQPVRNLDLAGIVTSVLGVPRLRHGGIGATRPLKVA